MLVVAATAALTLATPEALAFHKADSKDSAAIKHAALQAWNAAVAKRSCGEQMTFRGAYVSSANPLYGQAAIDDNQCTYGFGWYVKRSSAHSEDWKAVLAAPDSGQPCTYYAVLPIDVQRDFGVTGNIHDGAYARCANSLGTPRLFTNSVVGATGPNNTFKVKPPTIILDSADGGEITIHWTKWTSTVALGTGTAHPDHGSFPVQIRADYPADGDFTYLRLTHNLSGGPYTNVLVLTYSTDGYDDVSWERQDFVETDGCGCSPWPPSSS